MDAAMLHELFEYRDGNLYWKVAKARNIKAGNKAGHLNYHGYVTITINQKHYAAHRLVYIMHYGCVNSDIDHINGIKNDNRIENLRLASKSQNNQNTKLRKNNTSGVKGVSWHKQNKKWRVCIRLNGKQKTIGCYEDIEFASLVAEEARNKYHGSYANHG